jgi:hypothetical protein
MLERYFASGNEGSFSFSFSLNVIGGTAPFLGDVLDKEHLHDPKFWFIMIGFPTVLAFLLPALNFCAPASRWLSTITPMMWRWPAANCVPMSRATSI